MAEGITLLDFSVEPTKGINGIIKGAYDEIKQGLTNAKAKKICAYKVRKLRPIFFSSSLGPLQPSNL